MPFGICADFGLARRRTCFDGVPSVSDDDVSVRLAAGLAVLLAGGEFAASEISTTVDGVSPPSFAVCTAAPVDVLLLCDFGRYDSAVDMPVERRVS